MNLPRNHSHQIYSSCIYP